MKTLTDIDITDLDVVQQRVWELLDVIEDFNDFKEDRDELAYLRPILKELRSTED